jgi:hypothetical protein
MLLPAAKIAPVHCVPRVFRDPVVILSPIDDRRDRRNTSPDRAVSTSESTRSFTQTHFAGKEAPSQNRPRGGAVRVVFVKRTAKDQYSSIGEIKILPRVILSGRLTRIPSRDAHGGTC